MINRAHAILYSDDAEATRAALAKVLGTRSVDAGGGWLIFALPPAELAVHPAEKAGRAGPGAGVCGRQPPPGGGWSPAFPSPAPRPPPGRAEHTAARRSLQWKVG